MNPLQQIEKLGQVSAWLRELDQAIRDCSESGFVLKEKLRPILRSEQELGDASLKDSLTLVDIADQIRFATNCVKDINFSHQEMIRLLEL